MICNSHSTLDMGISLTSLIRPKEVREILFLSALMTALGVYAQLGMKSMFDVGDDLWLFRLSFHQDCYPFSARVLTTYPELWLGKFLGGRYELAFGVFQYSLYFLLGPIFYRYLRTLTFEHRLAMGGVAILYLSYPMVAAFHEPVCTWDDLLQYGAQILSFTLLLTGRFMASSLAFAFGVASREATVLLYPVWALTLWFQCRRSTWYRLSVLALPLLVGAGIWFYADKEPAAGRIHNIRENFRDAAWTRNTLYSLAMGLGCLWLTTPVAMAASRVRAALSESNRFLWWGRYMLLSPFRPLCSRLRMPVRLGSSSLPSYLRFPSPCSCSEAIRALTRFSFRVGSESLLVWYAWPALFGSVCRWPDGSFRASTTDRHSHWHSGHSLCTPQRQSSH